VKMLETNNTLTERVYNAIKEDIVNLKLAPGLRLKEEALSVQLGVSSSPIREALQRLEKDGLIVSLPRRGRFVRHVDYNEMIELYELREIIEGLAARKAVANITAAQLAEMEEAINKISFSILKKDIRKDQKSEFIFHRILCEAAGHKILIEMFDLLMQRGHMIVTNYDYTAKMDAASAEEARQEHLAIVEALRQGDADKAEHLVRRHIRKAIDVCSAVLNKNRQSGEHVTQKETAQ